jgi:molybdopterin molybdotransferase
MQEKVMREGNAITVTDATLNRGLNIRKAGSEIKKGKIALKKGSLLTPAACSFLTSAGITHVDVYRQPSVAIVVTGNELVKPGKKLNPGEIYESNSIALKLALQKEGISDISIHHVRDTKVAMKKIFLKVVATHDIVLFTGGISVGDYDFTSSVFAENGVKKVFYKLKQKPGKPIYFGTLKNKAVFGLPGNPASVMTCFYLYVIPAMRTMQNHPEKELRRIQLPLSGSFSRKPGMTIFLKAFTDYKRVEVLQGQQSYIMKSFASANALVMLDAETETVDDGEPVTTILLP